MSVRPLTAAFATAAKAPTTLLEKIKKQMGAVLGLPFFFDEIDTNYCILINSISVYLTRYYVRHMAYLFLVISE